MISARIYFLPINGENIKPDSRRNDGYLKSSGILINRRKNTIICNCFGSKKYARNYEGGGFQVGCNFISYLKSIHTTNLLVLNSNTPDKKRVISCPDWSEKTCVYTEQNMIRSNPS